MNISFREYPCLNFSLLNSFFVSLFLSLSPGQVFAQPVYDGSASFYSQAEIDAWSDEFTSITGYLLISGSDITDLTPLHAIGLVGNGLFIVNNPLLSDLSGLESIQQVNGAMSISDCPLLLNMEGLNGLIQLSGFLYIYNNAVLEDFSGLENLIHIGGNFQIDQNPSLTNFNGLDALSFIGATLDVSNCNQLLNMAGLESLTSMGTYSTAGVIFIHQCNSLTSLTGLSGINSIQDISIAQNNALLDLSGLENLNKITNSLSISGNEALISLDGLSNLTTVQNGLYVSSNLNLLNLSGLDGLDTVGFELNISYNPALQSLVGLESLSHVGFNASIFNNQNITTLNGIQNLSSVGFNLSITTNPSLTDCCPIYNLMNTPGAIGGSLILFDNKTGCDSQTEICDLDGDIDDDGFTSMTGDCDDLNPTTYPGAPELCGNGLDDDCDGTIDEQFTSLNIITDNIQNVTCPYGINGSISIHVAGGIAPYSYIWSNGSYDEDPSFLSAGIHTVTVTDALARCNTKSFTVQQPTPFDLTFTTTYPTCYGDSNGSATVHVTGGTGNYTYSWSNGGTSKKINNIPSSYYFVTITDAAGCPADLGVGIYQPDLFGIYYFVIDQIGSNYQLNVVTIGGTAPNKYRRSKPNGGWTTWQTSNIFNNVPAGDYTIQVKDDHNCEASTTISIPGNQANPNNVPGEFVEAISDDLTFVPNSDIVSGEQSEEEIDTTLQIPSADLLLFPNPTTDQLSIQKKDLAGKPCVIHIFNTLGMETLRLDVDEMPFNPLVLDLNNIESGIYLLTIEANGMDSATEYFVKVR